jgi:CRISPR-associated exonuclease Cas4
MISEDWFEVDQLPFRVSDLKQWVYCPRVLYFHHCLPDVRPVTYKMQIGIESGREAARREKRRGLRAYGLTKGRREFDLPLAAPRLGLRGQVDMVIWVEDSLRLRAVPVDYKLSRKVGSHFKLQLAAYGVMLEETHPCEVSYGFLYLIPLRQARRVNLNNNIRRQLEKTLAAMHRMLDTETMPPPTRQRRKCVGCEFRRFCNDVI